MTYQQAVAALAAGQLVRVPSWNPGVYVKENLPATSPETYQVYDPHPRFNGPHWRNFNMVDDGVTTWELYTP